MDNVIRHLRRMAARSGVGTPTDAELLERFVLYREEEAFTTLVRRHGPMVLGVCLRVLHHRQDAEDAFQATFLTLVRKGHGIRERGALASWLYRVAFRAALRLKSGVSKHLAEQLAEVPVNADPSADAAWRELRPVLDTEVQRLPAKYRAPLVLCYLEGKSYEEAADALGCPKGTVAIRLLRGKLLLKNRLARRGFILSVGSLAAHAVVPAAEAVVPSALASATLAAASALAAGTALSGATTASVAAVVETLSGKLWAKKLQTAVVLLLAVNVMGIGVGGYSWSQRGAAHAPAGKEVASAEAPPAAPAAPLDEQRNALGDQPREVKQAPTAQPPAQAQKQSLRPLLVIQFTANYELVGAQESCTWSARQRSRYSMVSESGSYYVIPTGDSAAAKSGLAWREVLTDETCTRSTPPAWDAPKKPVRTISVAAKLRSFMYRIILIREDGQVIILTPA